jgi:hypothetical protein
VNTARNEGWRIRWRLSSNQHTCALTSCNRPIGPTYLGLAICYEHFNQHVDEKSRFNLSRYAEGENSKLVLSSGLRGVETLEMINEDGLVDTIKAGDEVSWIWSGKPLYGTVDSITGKDAETVNRTKKSCAISDAVVIWVISGGKKIGLVAREVVALQESEEETIDDLLDLLKEGP